MKRNQTLAQKAECLQNHIKRILSLVIGIFLLALNSFANDVIEVDNLRYYLPSSGNNVTLVGGKLNSGNLEIPSTIQFRNKTFIVRYIKKNAFMNYNLSKVSIPETIIEIEEGAFKHAGITELVISEGVQFIRPEAFLGCRMQSVTIPNSVERLEESAFQGCKNLKTVSLGSGLKYLGGKAFAFCDEIEVVQCSGPVPPLYYSNAASPNFSNMTHQFAVLKVPVKYFTQYTKSFPWKNFENIEPIGTESEWTSFERLAMEYLNRNKEAGTEGQFSIKSSEYGGTNIEYVTLYDIYETTNNKGKVKSDQRITPIDVWRGFLTPTKYKIVKKDNSIMFYGSMTFRGMKKSVDFYSIPITAPFSKPLVINCLTDDGGSLTIEIDKVIEGPKSKVVQSNSVFGKKAYSVFPDKAWLKLTYTAPNNSTQKYLISVVGLPELYDN